MWCSSTKPKVAQCVALYERHATGGEHRLDQLLGDLLRVKADDRVGYLRVRGYLPHQRLVIDRPGEQHTRQIEPVMLRHAALDHSVSAACTIEPSTPSQSWA